MGVGSERVTSSERNWRESPGGDWGDERLLLERAERVLSLARAACGGTVPPHASAVANGPRNGRPQPRGAGLWGLWSRRTEDARAVLAPARRRLPGPLARDGVSANRGQRGKTRLHAPAVGDDQPRQRCLHARGRCDAGVLLVVALVRGSRLCGGPAAAPRSWCDGR